MNPVINKFLIALVTVLGVLIVVMPDGISAAEWVQLAIVFFGALGVYAVPNAASPTPR